MGKDSIKKETNQKSSSYSDTKDLSLQLLKMTKQFRDFSESTEKNRGLLFEKVEQLNLNHKKLDRKLEGVDQKIRRKDRILGEYKEKEYTLGEDLRRVEEENKNLRRELEEFNSFKKGAIWRYLGKYRRFKSLIKEKTGIGKRTNKPKLSIRRIKDSLATQMFNLYLLSGGTEKVSVVIPVWDRTKELEESIKSILHQSYKNIELIIVTDGSPPETLAVIKKYEDNPRVKIFYYYDNSGNAVRGRNKAIREATGKYFAFQDSDDIADRNRIKNSIRYIKKYNVDGVYGGWRAMVDGTRKDTGLKNRQEVFSPDCDLQMMKETCVPCQSTVMIKTDVLRKLGGLKEKMRYREDHELWTRFMYKRYKFKAIPKVLTNLRIHKGNAELLFKANDKKWYKELQKEYKLDTQIKPKIAYIIPSTGVGGGLGVIIQHVNRLLQRGYDTLLISEDDKTEIDWATSYVQTVPLHTNKRYLLENIDLLVATGWSTVKYLKDIDAERKLYFIQSDERRFFEEKDSHYIKEVEETYKSKYEFFTMAKWIQKWLKEEFNKNAYYVPNGLDTEIFHKTKPLEEKTDKLRVLIEGPIDIWFKGMHDAYAAVRNLDVELWIISSAGRPPSYWRYDRFFEKVPINKIKEIYSSCDVLLKMSKVESFCLPALEAMACECIPVVTDFSGSREFMRDGYNAKIIKIGDTEKAKEAIEELMGDNKLRKSMIKNGLNTVKNWGWDKSIDLLEEVIQKNPPKKFFNQRTERYCYKKYRDKYL